MGERHKRSPWDERISSNDAIGSGRFASHGDDLRLSRRQVFAPLRLSRSRRGVASCWGLRVASSSEDAAFTADRESVFADPQGHPIGVVASHASVGRPTSGGRGLGWRLAIRSHPTQASQPLERLSRARDDHRVGYARVMHGECRACVADAHAASCRWARDPLTAVSGCRGAEPEPVLASRRLVRARQTAARAGSSPSRPQARSRL